MLIADKRGWKGPAKVEQNEEPLYIPGRTATLPETQEEEDSEVCNPFSVKKQKTTTTYCFQASGPSFYMTKKPTYLNMMCEKKRKCRQSSKLPVPGSAYWPGCGLVCAK